MRVVVTGALGYIGSLLVREHGAASPGAEIVMIDNMSGEAHASLDELAAAGQHEFVEGDILSVPLQRLVEDADAVVHLAAITNGTGAEPHTRMHAVNVTGTERVARACAAARVPLLFPSTTSVYGTSGVVKETDPESSLRPQTPYAGWKLQSENLLHHLAESHGLRFAIFRMGTVFGPTAGMQFHTAVNRFCWQAMTQQPLEVWRTAVDQWRPYLDVRDAIRAMMFIVDRRQFDNRVYNVLSVNATVQHVVETLAQFVPDVRVALVDSPHMNSHSYTADNSRIRKLGFEFTGTLAQGISDTLARLARTQPGWCSVAHKTQ